MFATRAGRFQAQDLAQRLPQRDWQRISAGAGAKGQRFYDWALVATAETVPGHRGLLIRRNPTTGELAYYRCYSPDPAPLAALVTVAGTRWRVEEMFQQGKGLTGLDEHQVRRYVSWARWVPWRCWPMPSSRCCGRVRTPAPATTLLRWFRCPAARSSDCSWLCSPVVSTTLITGFTGQRGGAATRHEREGLIIAVGRYPDHDDHDLQLEY